MHIHTASQMTSPPGLDRPAARASSCRRVLSNGRKNAQFVEMMTAFRGHGGMLRSPEVSGAAGCGRRSTDALAVDPTSGPQPIQFDWDGSLWVPMFQFEPRTTRLCARVLAVIHQLPGAMSPWDIAVWFASPNRWLNLRTPISFLPAEIDRVCAAAGLSRVIG